MVVALPLIAKINSILLHSTTLFILKNENTVQLTVVSVIVLYRSQKSVFGKFMKRTMRVY